MTAMSEPGHPPEIPYPVPPVPDVPRRTDPPMVPLVTMPSGSPAERLFERRTVLVSGPLDTDAAGHLAAQLLALDRASADDIELVLNSPGGPLEDLAGVLDVMAMLRTRLNVTCTGMAGGSAAAAVACATGRRLAAPSARLSLRLPDEGEHPGLTADELARRVEDIAQRRAQLVGALVTATGQHAPTIKHELDAGSWHDAAAAKQLGLVDEILQPRNR